MTPIDFPQANITFSPPADLDESQCRQIRAFAGSVQGGSVDGSQMIITAWLPSPDELAQLMQGKPIYVSFLGGLPPHFVTADFNQAINPQ